jgi:hypothetical protein
MMYQEPFPSPDTTKNPLYHRFQITSISYMDPNIGGNGTTCPNWTRRIDFCYYEPYVNTLLPYRCTEIYIQNYVNTAFMYCVHAYARSQTSKLALHSQLIRKDKPGWQQASPILQHTTRYHPRKNLPTLILTLPKTQEQHVTSLMSALCITESANVNLSNAQEELLCWRFRLGHVIVHHMQWMIQVG